MAVQLQDAYAIVGFLGTAAFAAFVVLAGVYKGVMWLRDQVAGALDSHQEELTRQVEDHHRENVIRFDRIEKQTTATNGKLAEHDQRITRQEARTELLTEMILNKQPDGGK